jgi:succinyl-diaminopimelate desuccinylase
MTVGLISGGINTNVVPDRVVFRLDRRMVPEENPAEVEAELRAVIARAAGLHPDAKVAVRRILLAEPLTPTPAGAKLTETLCRRASRVMGEPVAASGVPSARWALASSIVWGPAPTSACRSRISTRRLRSLR